VIIEDQTPIDEVVFEPSTWVQESFWLLPDLMSAMAQANSTQIPTWHNVDLYSQSLIRQSFLGAWDAFHQTFDEANSTTSNATQVAPRIQATVSYSRVFSWLAISLLTSIAGILLIVLTWGEGKPAMSEDASAEVTEEEKKNAKEILHILADSDFF